MRFVLNLVNGLTLLYVAKIIEGIEECIESNATAKRVRYCPKNESKWKEAAAKKNCGNIKNRCSSFEYHCVINAWRNETIEVCAPKLNIVGGNCAEYNFGGSRIQRNEKVNCSRCRMSYESTKSYQYQECYDYTTTATLPTSETTTESLTGNTSTQSNNATSPVSINGTKLGLLRQRQHNTGFSISSKELIIVICIVIAVVGVLIAFLIKIRSKWTKHVFLKLKRFCGGNQSNGIKEEPQDTHDTPDVKTLIRKKLDAALTTDCISSTELLKTDSVNSIV